MAGVERSATMKNQRNENPAVIEEWSVLIRSGAGSSEVYLRTTSIGTAIHTTRAVAHGVAAGMEAASPNGWRVVLSESLSSTHDAAGLLSMLVRATSPAGTEREVVIEVAPWTIGGAR
jgi:archaellin